MNLEQLLLSKQISVNKLSQSSGVPRTTILDIVKGRSDLRKASGLTLYKLSKALGITIENLIDLDSPFVRDEKTGKPKDCSYFECSLDSNLSRILKNLKNAVYSGNLLKQDYWKDLLLEEITSLRRKDKIGTDSYEYFFEHYCKGSER